MKQISRTIVIGLNEIPELDLKDNEYVVSITEERNNEINELTGVRIRIDNATVVKQTDET